jgi:hypothetical protein
MASSTPSRSPNANESSSNTSPSCRKCVKVLQELVSGLQDDSKKGDEPPPLTLLKAIAGDQSKKLRVENSEDGVTMHFPVDITKPSLLKRWTQFTSQQEETGRSDLEVPLHTLATSASGAASANSTPSNPLTIQLTCRKCSSTGPEVS